MRLLVADATASDGSITALKSVARAGETCRLGKGLDRSGLIEEAMVVRAQSLAQDFARRARALGARRMVVGATAALRRASNGAEAADRIAESCGLPIRVLSGEEEARIVYRAVVLGLGSTASRSPCVVFDIGGGSTEVVSGFGADSGRWTSVPYGAVNLTERHLSTNPASDSDQASLLAEVRSTIMHQCADMPDRAPLLAGVGGTVTVLALLDQGLTHYDPGSIEGWTIERGRLHGLIDRLIQTSQEERRSWPAMGEGRADIVVAGALVVRVLAERFPSGGLVCSTQGLRYGLARIAAEEALAAGD